MSFEIVGLGKLLRVMYADKAGRISILRGDIRDAIRRESASSTKGGGDFYGPFWADAKRHVAGEVDLRAETPQRILKNTRRERLYEISRDGFLLWWEEKRRLRNEPFKIIEASVKARYDALGLGAVKIENILAITVGDDGHRIIYPYFCEDPSLTDEAARLGLWVMSQCIVGYAAKDMRIWTLFRGDPTRILIRH
ncbi:hypothetical protein J2W51_001042 [Tardiphaga robiniae]|uniref:hypothetical protein n=1 Tax=Tardiphaga robiniae TaxID=943830 RepID=UPI002864A287|nr:hypothetical protein [Tardiphaga robiniae]MDR6658500.1 hypothetical protein [Tardiphaga robiniae]